MIRQTTRCVPVTSREEIEIVNSPWQDTNGARSNTKAAREPRGGKTQKSGQKKPSKKDSIARFRS